MWTEFEFDGWEKENDEVRISNWVSIRDLL